MGIEVCGHNKENILSITEKLKNSIIHWQTNPLDWYYDIIDMEKLPEINGKKGLSNQQENAFKELGKLYKAKLKLLKSGGDKKKLTDEENYYALKIGLSIAAGQTTGKDFWLAATDYHFMMCYSFCKILATASTGKQLKNVYWAELSKLMRLAKPIDPNNPHGETILQNLFTWQSEKVFMNDYKGKEWFIEAVTINTKGGEEEQAESLAGRNEMFKKYSIDEATGVPDPVFKPIEGSLGGKLNVAILIFNYTRNTGFAAKTQTTDKDRWITLRWNAEDSNLVSKQHCEIMEKKYGKYSTPYRVRILGLPPLSDENTLIPRDWIEDAKDREDFDVSEDTIKILSFDIGAGGDESRGIFRHGPNISKPIKLLEKNARDTDVISNWILELEDVYEPDEIYIDNIGVGWGVYCIVSKRAKCRIYAADVRTKQDLIHEEKFRTKRDELSWTLRKQFEQKMISIPNDDELIDQLSFMTYDTEVLNGVIKVVSKRELRASGKDSPNSFDALMLSYYRWRPGVVRRIKNRKLLTEKYGHQRPPIETDNKLSWMAG